MTRTLALLGLLAVGCGPIGLTPIPWDTGSGGGPGPGPGPDSEPDDETDPHETDPGEESAPELSAFEMTERSSDDTIQVTYDAFDLDGDLTGGLVSITVGGRAFSLDIPTDLDQYNATGTSRFHLDASQYQPGERLDGVLYLVDAAGHRSDSLNDSLVMAGSSYTITERGDTENTGQDLGVITLPATLEGDIYRASNDGYGYTGDLDWIEFRVGSAVDANFSLTWTASGADYDLHLLRNGNTEGQSIQDGATQPESFTRPLSANTTYVIVVAGWNGNPGNYTLTIR